MKENTIHHELFMLFQDYMRFLDYIENGTSLLVLVSLVYNITIAFCLANETHFSGFFRLLIYL